MAAHAQCWRPVHTNTGLCDEWWLHGQTKIFFDVLCQSIVNFTVAGDGLLFSGGWIVIDIVPSTVPKKSAALLFDLANKLATLHKAISLVL